MFEKIKMKNLIRAVYILLIVAVITGATYSRYMMSLLGTDSASVATFVVTSDIVESATFEIPYDITTDGETYTYELIITNYDENGKVCDVDMDYTAVLSSIGNLPLDIVLRETNNTGETTADESSIDADATTSEGDESSEEYEKEDGYGTVEDNKISGASFTHTEEVKHIYYIEVSWQEGASKDYRLSYEIDLITVTIDAEQNMDSKTESAD